MSHNEKYPEQRARPHIKIEGFASVCTFHGVYFPTNLSHSDVTYVCMYIYVFKSALIMCP